MLVKAHFIHARPWAAGPGDHLTVMRTLCSVDRETSAANKLGVGQLAAITLIILIGCGCGVIVVVWGEGGVLLQSNGVVRKSGAPKERNFIEFHLCDFAERSTLAIYQHFWYNLYSDMLGEFQLHWLPNRMHFKLCNNHPHGYCLQCANRLTNSSQVHHLITSTQIQYGTIYRKIIFLRNFSSKAIAHRYGDVNSAIKAGNNNTKKKNQNQCTFHSRSRASLTAGEIKWICFRPHIICILYSNDVFLCKRPAKVEGARTLHRFRMRNVCLSPKSCIVHRSWYILIAYIAANVLPVIFP